MFFDISCTEIVDRIKSADSPAMRPELQPISEPEFNPMAIGLIEHCWAELPQNRPTFTEVEKTIKKLNKGK